MEAGLKDFAAGVETLVDRVVSGDLGGEVASHMDKFMCGFIRHFEDNYSKFEAAVRQTFGLPKRVPPPRRAKVGRTLSRLTDSRFKSVKAAVARGVSPVLRVRQLHQCPSQEL